MIIGIKLLNDYSQNMNEYEKNNISVIDIEPGGLLLH